MMLFYIFIFFLIGIIFSSLMVILVKNPIHSILFLILVFFNTSGLLFLLGFEYLAIIFIIIYIGAIAVLFLFVVMMLNIRLIELNEIFYKYLPLGLIIGLIFGLEILLVFLQTFKIFNMEFFFNENNLSQNFYINWFNLFNSVDNLKIIALIFFVYKFLFLFLAGFILLLAMIGAIVLVFNEQRLTRKQLIYKQILRNKNLKLIN